jgi:hypothetical protein
MFLFNLCCFLILMLIIFCDLININSSNWKLLKIIRDSIKSFQWEERIFDTWIRNWKSWISYLHIIAISDLSPSYSSKSQRVCHSFLQMKMNDDLYKEYYYGMLLKVIDILRILELLFNYTNQLLLESKVSCIRNRNFIFN